MAIPTVVNFELDRIPVEGSETFRADASYVWARLPEVVASHNDAIAAENGVIDDINIKHDDVTVKHSEVEAVKNTVNQDKTDIDTMKGEVLEAKEHIDGIKEGIDGAITDAVNTQIGVYTDAIRRNSTKIKMQNFGLKLI